MTARHQPADARLHVIHRWSIARVGALAFLSLTSAPSVAAAQTEVVEYYAVDAVGSIRVVFSASGDVVARTDYEPFGERVDATGALPPRQFTGYPRDPEAGFDYAGARYYQVRTGRFAAVDPADGSPEDPQRWNRYAYARQSPLVLVDPDGQLARAYASNCNAEFSMASCGGDDAFWESFGGFDLKFGNVWGYARQLGWSPGMPADMFTSLIEWNIRAEQAFENTQTSAQSQGKSSGRVTTTEEFRPANEGRHGASNVVVSGNVNAVVASPLGGAASAWGVFGRLGVDGLGGGPYTSQSFPVFGLQLGVAAEVDVIWGGYSAFNGPAWSLNIAILPVVSFTVYTNASSWSPIGLGVGFAPVIGVIPLKWGASAGPGTTRAQCRIGNC